MPDNEPKYHGLREDQFFNTDIGNVDKYQNKKP